MDDYLALLPDLLALAEGQHGQVGLTQLGLLQRSAVVEHWSRLGLVEPVTGEVVRVRAGGRHRFPQLYAAWLGLTTSPAWTRTPASSPVVSHRSAARLYQALATPATEYEFTSTTQLRGSVGPSSGRVTPHVLVLAEDEVRIVEGMLVTTPARTVVDLGADNGLDLGELGRVCQNLIAGGWTSEASLARDLFDTFTRRSLDTDGEGWLQEALEAAAA